MITRSYSNSQVQQRLDAMAHAVRIVRGEWRPTNPAELDEYADQTFALADEIYLWATLGVREITPAMLDERRAARSRHGLGVHPAWCTCDEICARISDEDAQTEQVNR